MSDKSKLFIIGIGGSGAKCIESIVHLAAAGLYSEEAIEILFIDPDEANGNVERARNSLRIYQDCQQLISGGNRLANINWMSTPIKSHNLWSPFSEQPYNKDLASFFKYNSMEGSSAPLANLFDVLYAPEERQQQLDEGFRGRPAIGAAVMSQVDLKQLDKEPWASLIQSISNDANNGKKPKILLCGSVFGGTGASGVPTIAKLLRSKLKADKLENTVKIGGIFLLPYFSFSAPSGEDSRGLYAAADRFLLNTEAALRYYVSQAGSLFDTVYVLGNENSVDLKFSVGKGTQTNLPHFVELYAGLAARNFLKVEDRNNPIVLISRQQTGRLTWQDLPESPLVQKLMGNATRFAYNWLSDFEGELAQLKGEGFKGLQKFARWATPYYDDRVDSQIKFDSTHQQNGIQILSDWSKDYLRWMSNLHDCQTDRIELFKTEIFNKHIQKGSLPDLLLNDARDPNTRAKQDDLAAIKTRLMSQKLETIEGENKGTIGLAKSLYLNAELN
jgi:hypothetical protein